MHALLWWLNDDTWLEPEARNLIADPDNDVLASAVSLWESVVKVWVGKLGAEIGEIAEAIEQEGFSLLTITTAHLIALAGLLRHPNQRDPFDHPPIAQAIADGAACLSEDRNSPSYLAPVIACSR